MSDFLGDGTAVTIEALVRARAETDSALADRDSALSALRSLLQAYAHVFSCELSTTEQQRALAKARRLVKEQP